MKREMVLTVNGEEHDIEIEPNRLLLEALREDVGLTGTKEGCSIGVCGACSVIVDGRLVSACLTLAVTCEGQADRDHRRAGPWRRAAPAPAFLRAVRRLQCGICTPGQIMAAKALLDQNPNPTTDQVKEWMSANLCRCTGYYKILESVMAVVEGKVEAGKSDEAGRQARIQSLYHQTPTKATLRLGTEDGCLSGGNMSKPKSSRCWERKSTASRVTTR